MSKARVPIETIVKLLEQDYQCSKIADELKLSGPTIRRICKEYNLTAWLKVNGKKAQIKHNRSVRWIHGDRSRLTGTRERLREDE